MTGASAAMARIRAAAEPMLTAAHAAGGLRRQAALVENAADLDPALVGMVSLILATEQAAEALTLDAKRLRATLAAVMDDTGCPSVRAPFHTAAVSAARQVVVVIGPVPQEYMRTPEPAPDKVALLRALKDGETINGAQLSNGGGPVLSIRARETRV